MKLLILGSGGREHALVWKCSQSRTVQKLYCAPGSEAISAHAECVAIDPADPLSVTGFCVEKGVDLVIVGPARPLAAGVADYLRKAGVRVFGPGQSAARLESSKAFSKQFLVRHSIPTARGHIFRSANEAVAALDKMKPPIVIKADGLSGGKGVCVCPDRGEAAETIEDFMRMKTLQSAGDTVVIEEYLEGAELTAMALCDGKTFKLLPYARDHRHLLDGDKGPDTDGMGAYAPVDVDAAADSAIREIFAATLAGMHADGLDFRGLLYIGLMLTAQGPKVLEYNSRFGDPEAQSILPLLDCDLVSLALACAEGRLASAEIKLGAGACVCVTLASENYPRAPMTGRPVTGLEDISQYQGVLVFHAGTGKKDGRWVTTGGRVLSITAAGPDLAAARRLAYESVARVHFDGMLFRRDIANEVLSAK